MRKIKAWQVILVDTYGESHLLYESRNKKHCIRNLKDSVDYLSTCTKTNPYTRPFYCRNSSFLEKDFSHGFLLPVLDEEEA
jgi:hypothetical protein